MKKFLFSLIIIAAAAAIAISSTTAFFSNREISEGNTFTAGAIDLTIDSQCSFNGASSTQCGTFALKDLVPTADRFFNFTNLKPTDYGANSISLHVLNNDAWVCAEISNLTNLENGQTEPEALVDATAGADQGELQSLTLTIWRDANGDNIQDPSEAVLAADQPANGILAVYDSTSGTGPLTGGLTAYLGVKWELPSAAGNTVQTDSLTGDISFRAVQSRNNANFACKPEPILPIIRISQLKPNYTAPGGGGVFCAYRPPARSYISPGATVLYDGREAGIIKAGFTAQADGHYTDEGIYSFIPNVTINSFASGIVTYEVKNQAGISPVWMTIEIDTGVAGWRSDNITYQFVPTTNPAGWHTVNAAAGLWQKWNNGAGDTTGNPLISLSAVAAAHPGLNVVRTYLRLGMGDAYYNGGTGTIVWIDKATLGGKIYDFVLP